MHASVATVVGMTTEAVQNLPTRRELESLAEVCRTLAEPNRLAILELLARRPGLSINMLMEELGASPYGVGLSQPTISHHIRILVRTGFVKAAKAGTYVHVTVNRTRLRELAEHIKA